MIDFPEDQGAVAWGNVLPQHKNKPGLEGQVKAFYGPLTRLTTALKALREQRGVDTAVGAQLDGVGVIVGVSRSIPLAVFLAYFGYAHQTAGRGYGQARYRKTTEAYATAYTLSDVEYRSLIKAKIIQNNSHGTFDEIIAACELLFDAVYTRVLNNGAANLTVEVYRNKGPNYAIHPYYEKFLPIASGVSHTSTYYEKLTTLFDNHLTPGDKNLDVVSSTGFAVGNTVGIKLDQWEPTFNGLFNTTIDSISGNTLVLHDALPIGASAGNPVFRRI